VGTYSENDVRAAAYCFSGWTIDLTTNSFRLNLRQHSAASQTFLGQSGVNSGQQVIDIATGSHESARYVPCAFWSHLAYPVQTDDVVVADLVGGYSATATSPRCSMPSSTIPSSRPRRAGPGS